jgi:hypothetical protein
MFVVNYKYVRVQGHSVEKERYRLLIVMISPPKRKFAKEMASLEKTSRITMVSYFKFAVFSKYVLFASVP